jgi:hypothetical protein
MSAIVVDVGDVPVLLRTSDRPLAAMIERRFHRFVQPAAHPQFEFDITVPSTDAFDADADLQVRRNGDCWHLTRGDFHAEWSVEERRGRIHQAATPYAIDSVLRIVHSIVLSKEGGFLLHAASAIRGGRAFLFTGPSGAGKTTIAKLAPADAVLLSDEISYVRRDGDGYTAYGTPFAGELGESGAPAQAPVAALFALGRGAGNDHVPLAPAAAVRTLLRNILFFADEQALVDRLFATVCHFAERVPVHRLDFAPDARVWDTIQ